MKTRILFILLLAIGLFNSKAQNHPVKVVVQAMPPYLVRLADYTTATEPRLYVQLLLADMQQGLRQVRLHVSLTGNSLNIQSTQLQQGSNPYVIYSGQPLRLSNMDMQALFRYENLQGLTPAQYREPLPEGFYKLGFTVYDHITGLPLSQRTEVPLFLTLSNPPVLNLPSRGESVQATTVPNLFFNWSPRHQGIPNVQYEFSLVEIWDDYLSPEQAFLAATPLWTEVTRSNSLLYNLSKPPLQEGKRYAWRVRAFTGDVNNSEALFKNNGCSEIFYFTYTVTCEAPMYLLSHITGARSVTVQWQEAAHFDHYRLQYRKVSYKTEEVTRRVKNKETGERERVTTTEEVREVSAWFEVNTPNTQTRLSNLEENTEYEYRVGGHCRNNADQQSFTYSIIQRFTTPSRDDSETAYQCGVLPKIELDNAEPLITLAVNESFMAGDFPVTVTEVNGGKGTYTGRGYIVVPYLADTRLEVSFNGIFINDQYQMLRGMIETAYDASGQNIVSTGEVSNLLDGNQGKKEHQVDFEIADIQYYPETGRVAIIGTNGEKVVLTGADSYEVVDATGKVYHINQDGVQVAGEQSPNGKPDAQTTQGISAGSNGQAQLTSLNRSSGVTVRFVANASQLYGFDAVETDAPDELKALYTQIEGEYLPCKSVVYRQTDFIDFVVEGIEADSVEFVTLNTGRVIQATGNTLTLDGIEQYGSETILARCSSKLAGGDTLQQHMVIGAFELVYLPGEKHIDLTVIPTNGRKVPGLELEQTLNTIYKSVGVRFNIKVDTAYTAPYKQLNDEESAFYANYTGEQKAIINDYRSRRPVNPNHYYVFYSNITRNTGSAQELGYMPIQRQFGFIYTGGNSQTLAHELAHGVFHLRHTFSSSNETVIPQGHTENLMDYTNGKVLFKYQWEKIHNPDIVLFAFLEDDEEGAMRRVRNDEWVIRCLNFLRDSYKESKTGEVNIYELGRYLECYGNVSLVNSCNSDILVVTGMDAWDSKDLIIDKQKMIEGESFISGYDYKFSFENIARNDKANAISIYCKIKDKKFISDFIIGVPEDKLLCIDLPNCDDMVANKGYNSSEAITSILNQIQQGNISGDKSVSLAWPQEVGNALLGCEVKLYEGLDFRIAVTKDINTKNINCNMQTVTYSSHNRPGSRWEIFKSFLNDLGASFELGEFSGSEKLRVFEFYDKDNPNQNLRIVVEERYSNILGYYLFGENWDSDFTKNDRQWVLYLYSPSISEKFSIVKEQKEENLLEQRRLTYYALTNKFAESGFGRKMGGANSYLGQYNYAAQLKSNPNAAIHGVTVYTFDYINGELRICDEPIQYTANNQVDKRDIFYPVDVKLWDGDNNKPSLGNNFYGDMDFKGKYMEGSFAVGPPTGGGGAITGYLKGFGYNEFSYLGIGGTTTYTIGVSGATGLVDGKYEGEGTPTPLNFCGPGSSVTFSASELNSPLGFSLSDWDGFNSRGRTLWKGISVGLNISFEIKESKLPGSLSKVRVQTNLHFPSLEKTNNITIELLEKNSYYVGD